MAARTIEATPRGTLREADVRRTVRGVHVVCGKNGAWEVRLFAPMSTKTFKNKEDAVSYPKKVAADSRRKLFQHGVGNVQA